jgi:hypothetical protein
MGSRCGEAIACAAASDSPATHNSALLTPLICPSVRAIVEISTPRQVEHSAIRIDVIAQASGCSPMFSRPNPLDPTGKPQLDPKAYQDFLSWWQSVGGQGNINDAARRWITIRNPVFIDPSNPASMGRSPPAPARGGSEPPPQAVQLLRSNPSLAPQFEQKYGPGSASRYLGR